MGPVGAAEIAKALEGQNVHPMRHVYLDNSPMGAEISQSFVAFTTGSRSHGMMTMWLGRMRIGSKLKP